jgi:hypothetical protein
MAPFKKFLSATRFSMCMTMRVAYYKLEAMSGPILGRGWVRVRVARLLAMNERLNTPQQSVSRVLSKSTAEI